MKETTQIRALVALGSNRGDSRRILLEAAGRLERLSAAPLVRSSLWQSSPVDCPAGSPDFWNAVVALVPLPDETPESLLKKLQTLEAAFGRVPKKILNEPRPLDLDLIAFGGETRATPELTLPHPRAHLRRFVLDPLNEIAPAWILAGATRGTPPGGGRAATVADLLAALGTVGAPQRIGPFE